MPSMKMTTARTPWRETPLVESTNLSKAAGCRIFLKLENLQPSGSFKSRGLGFYCQKSFHASSHPGKVHFYSSSGGNAGLGCVYSANFLGRPSTVVVPMSTKPMMIAKIKAAGASEVVQMGAHWSEADAYLRDVLMPNARARGEEPVYVSPFDHEWIFEGHSTMVDEVREQLELLGEDAPDLMVCSAGGGGLFCGIVQGVEAQGKDWEKTKILVTQTQGADCLAKCLEAGKPITLSAITSLATSLGASRVADRAFELASTRKATGKVMNAVLTDAEAAMGTWRFADDERMLVELACGVNTALCYGGRLAKALGRPVRKEEKVVLVICGGSNTTTEMVENYRTQFGAMDADGTKDYNGEVASAITAPDSTS